MTALKAILFYPMLFVRKPFMLLSKFIGIILIFAFTMASIFGGVPWTLKLFTLGLAFALFLLRHFYDIILLKLNPTNTELTLQQ